MREFEGVCLRNWFGADKRESIWSLRSIPVHKIPTKQTLQQKVAKKVLVLCHVVLRSLRYSLFSFVCLICDVDNSGTDASQKWKRLFGIQMKMESEIAFNPNRKTSKPKVSKASWWLRVRFLTCSRREMISLFLRHSFLFSSMFWAYWKTSTKVNWNLESAFTIGKNSLLRKRIFHSVVWISPKMEEVGRQKIR